MEHIEGSETNQKQSVVSDKNCTKSETHLQKAYKEGLASSSTMIIPIQSTLPRHHSDPELSTSFVSLSTSEISPLINSQLLHNNGPEGSIHALTIASSTSTINEPHSTTNMHIIPTEERIREHYFSSPRHQAPDSSTSMKTQSYSSVSSVLTSRLMISFGVDFDELTPNQIDRFGFVINKDDKSSIASSDIDNKSKAQTKAQQRLEKYLVMEKEKEVTRSMKWVRMLRQLEQFPPNQWSRLHKKFPDRLLKGIPNCLRNKVWGLLFQAMKKEEPDIPLLSYNELYSQSSEYERQIDLDVERTLRNHILFKLRFGTGQGMLFKILVALANHNPKVGYCQGMSSVAAFFLLYFDEETAFNHLVTLFRSQDLDGLFEHGFPKLFESFYIHNRLLQHYYPKVLKHLNKHQISPSVYATKWYMTLFLGLPYLLAARIWDLFLFYGFEIFYHACITLLYYFEDKILKFDYEDTMQFLSKCDEQIIHPDRFIFQLKTTFLKSRSSKHHSINKYRLEYQSSNKVKFI